jgi:anti-sigma regulatory factor (Ser/Thr protein kinase)
MEGFELTLPARAESVAEARQAAGELGRRLGLPARQVDELRTIVSEASMNAAVHAYDVPGKSFNVAARANGKEITVTVSDCGQGIRPRPASQSSSARLGLLLLAALSHRVEISRRPAGGTRITVTMPAGTAGNGSASIA